MRGAAAERLIAAAQAARQAAHGEKERIYAAACADLGISRATLGRKLKEMTVTTPRKKRSDAGKTALTREEAITISGAIMKSARKNDKRPLFAIGEAVDALRADGKIMAASVDEETGEVRYLSCSAISRAMYQYGVHPEQLLAPAPATQLASLHPNHVWQLDASLCVLYYLKPSADGGNGLNVMPEKEFNKNKPRNLARIASNRVWSYEITDHTSGWIYVEYVMGAESGENLCNTLINAMQERGGADVMHGVPKILFTDPGAANLSAMAKNLCLALGIRQIAHAPGKARATGQVENARNLIQNSFESGLRFRPVRDIDALNEHAAKWRAWYNRDRIHSRHGKTRTDCWLTITEDQLVKAPPVEVCRQMAVFAPKSRQVSIYQTISFEGKEYDVSSVPGVMVHEKLLVTLNPWCKDSVQIVMTGEDGRDTYHVCPVVERSENGYRIDAPVIGESYFRPADTPAQKALQEIETLVSGTESQKEQTASQRKKQIPFDGQFNPFKRAEESYQTAPTYLPRRGTEHTLSAPKVEYPPLTHVEAAKQIKTRIESAGQEWTADKFAWLQQRYPESVPQDQLDNIVAELTSARASHRVPLRVAGGAK